MEFNKCSRCGSFYIAQGNVCPKCCGKDNLEFTTFKAYVQENGLNENLDAISGATGISVKNLNRFLDYDGFNTILKNQAIHSMPSNRINLD